MRTVEELKQYEPVATVVEYRGLVELAKQHAHLLTLKRVAEFARVDEALTLAIEDLDARLDLSDVEPDDAAA